MQHFIENMKILLTFWYHLGKNIKRTLELLTIGISPEEYEPMKKTILIILSRYKLK